MKKGFSNSYRKIERPSNYIGKSHWGEQLHAELDDLKLFSKGLNPTEIDYEMNKDSYEHLTSQGELISTTDISTSTKADTTSTIISASFDITGEFYYFISTFKNHLRL